MVFSVFTEGKNQGMWIQSRKIQFLDVAFSCHFNILLKCLILLGCEVIISNLQWFSFYADIVFCVQFDFQLILMYWRQGNFIQSDCLWICAFIFNASKKEFFGVHLRFCSVLFIECGTWHMVNHIYIMDLFVILSLSSLFSSSLSCFSMLMYLLDYDEILGYICYSEIIFMMSNLAIMRGINFWAVCMWNLGPSWRMLV